MKTEDTEALGRQLNQARSKHNRPVRTAHTFVHHYNSTQYCNTETVFICIPLPPDQPTSHLRCGQVEVGAGGDPSL